MPKDKPKPLIEVLPKALVETVIGYLNNTYPILISTHGWLLEDRPEIAVDGARLYVIVKAEGIKALSHSSANLKEEERRCMELGDPQWFSYDEFSSSHDGRYISFSHKYKMLTDRGEQSKCSTKWLAQSSELEGGGFRQVVFDSRNSLWGLLSRDGRGLFSYNKLMDVTRVYQIVEEAGKDPSAFMKRELHSMVRAVSGNGNRAVISTEKQLEIHGISNDASRLVCQLDDVGYTYALSEDGSEAAFVNYNGELRIMDVDRIAGSKADQPAIVTVNVPESLGLIVRLVYSDGDKLHALHDGGCVSLFDPSTKTLIPVEVPQEEQGIVGWAISPNADYIATIQYVGKEEESKRRIYRTTVRRKFESAEWRSLFGYVSDKVTSNRKHTKRPSGKQQ